MQRNVRNEITTALIVFLLLVAVVMSALVLTTADEDAGVTATPVEVISNVGESTPVQTETDEEIPTEETPVRPSATSTPTLEPPTNTPTQTETATSVPVSDTPTPTSTSTPMPSRTRIITFGALRPTATPTHTPTEISPTSVSAVATATRTQETITNTPTVTLTATPTVTSTVIPDPTDEPCAPPSDWITYTVGRGNTLFSIARAVGSTVGELKEVNCIADADNIQTGDMIAVPRAPLGPVRTGVPPRPAGDYEALNLRAEGCGSPASSIASPAAGQRLSGLFTVQGTAALDDFQFYRLEVRPDFTNIYNFYSRSEQPVVTGSLGQINTELFDDGLFWVRLTVIDNTGNFIEPCAIPVIFD